MAEATRKFANLQSDLREAQDDKIKPKDASGNLKPVKRKILRKNTTTRKTQELKLAFSEFYLSLILLQNYQNLNYTGFRKIMKKHDKVYLFIYFTYIYTIFIFNTMYVVEGVRSNVIYIYIYLILKC